MNNSCPICFEELVDKSRASPDVCDHIFCLPCLEKWSKHGSFCPVDRKRFKKIINLDSETAIQIKPVKPKHPRVLYDVTVYCEVCKKHNNAGTLLLCDCCDLGYHCKCLTPPLKEVPAGQWYCPVCVAVEIRINTTNGSTKKVQHIVEDCMKSKDTQDKTDNSGNKDLLDNQTNIASTKEVQHIVEDRRKSKDTHDKSDNSGNNDLPDNQTSTAINDVCNIFEPSLKKTVLSTNLKNGKHHCQNLQDIQITNSTKQSNIARSNRSFACSQEHPAKKEAVSMGIRKKDKGKHKYFHDKTKDFEDAFSTALSSIVRSKISFQNKKEQQAKKETESTLLCKKDDKNLRNCVRETIDLGNNSPAIQSSIARSILNREEQSIKIETVSNGLSKADKQNLRDCDVGTTDIEDSSSTVQSIIVRYENNIHSRKEQYAKKETESTGLNRENNRRLKDGLIEIIDLGDYSPAIQNNMARCIQNGKEQHINKELTDLSKKVNSNLRDSQIETINMKENSPASLSNFTRRGSRNQNILEESFKTPIASTSHKNMMDEKKLKNSQGDIIYVANISPAYISNAARSNKKSFNKLKQHNKIEIALESHLQNDSSNCRSLHKGAIDIGSSTESQSNAARSEGSIHDIQEEDSTVAKKEVLSSLRSKIKRRMGDQQGEAIGFKNNSNKYSSISGNEIIIHNSRKHSKKIVELITLSKKKEKISKHYHGEPKGVNDLDSSVFQTNMAISEKGIQRSKDEHSQKNNAQTYLRKLKDSLIEELKEHKSKVRIDSCTNLYFSSEKNKVGSQSKSSDNWYLEKKSCKDSGTIGQQEVLMKNMPLLDSSPINTALSHNDQISWKTIQTTNAPVNYSCDIKNSTRDNFKRNVTSSQFSVFETLEDTFVSSQKYLRINKAVGEMEDTTITLPLFNKNFPTLKKYNSLSSENILKKFNSQEIFRKSCNLKKASVVHNPSQNYNVRQVNYAIKAKMKLAEELKKIEKEKWTSSFKKRKHPRLSHSAIPEKLQKNFLNFPSASVSKQL